MNKEQIYQFLKNHHIDFEVTEHEAVFNMTELGRVDVPYPGRDAKNLFVRDDKKQNYYLITVKGNKRVDLKAFKKEHGTRHLSFASADDLMSLMKLTPGAVTPLGLLNDDSAKIQFFLDQDFLDTDSKEKGAGIIGIHPCDNTATVWLKTKDLVNLIKSHGTPTTLISLNSDITSSSTHDTAP